MKSQMVSVSSIHQDKRKGNQETQKEQEEMKLEVTTLANDDEGYVAMVRAPLLEFQKAFSTDAVVSVLITANILPSRLPVHVEPNPTVDYYTDGVGASEDLIVVTKLRSLAEKFVQDVQSYLTKNEEKVTMRRNMAMSRKSGLLKVLAHLQVIDDEMRSLGIYKRCLHEEVDSPVEVVEDELRKLEWVS